MEPCKSSEDVGHALSDSGSLQICLRPIEILARLSAGVFSVSCIDLSRRCCSNYVSLVWMCQTGLKNDEHREFSPVSLEAFSRLHYMSPVGPEVDYSKRHDCRYISYFTYCYSFTKAVIAFSNFKLWTSPNSPPLMQFP